MPTTIINNDGNMKYKLTEKGIEQYSIFPNGERFDCTWGFLENREHLPVPNLWKINRISLFGLLFESRFASDDEWEQIKILQKGFGDARPVGQ